MYQAQGAKCAIWLLAMNNLTETYLRYVSRSGTYNIRERKSKERSKQVMGIFPTRTQT